MLYAGTESEAQEKLRKSGGVPANEKIIILSIKAVQCLTFKKETMSYFLGIAGVVVILGVAIFAGVKLANILNLTGFKRFICVFAVVWLVFTITNSIVNPDFTGNPQKDGKILYERIYVDNEDFDTVYEELQEYYLEEGYGMSGVKEAMSICSDIRANN